MSVAGPLMTVGPVADETLPFWQACAEGRLVLRHCVDCARPHHYPRSLCPFCQGQTQWQDATGQGTVYAFSIQRRPEEFVLAYVTLDDGITMLSRVVGCPPGEVRIGQRVRVSFVASSDGLHVPVFRPA